MTRVKICGIRSLEEALWAVEAGADALGFILVPHSKRYIEPQKLRQITAHLPPFINKVGVFAGEPPNRVSEIIRYCFLDTIQFHGGEPVDHYRHIKAAKIKVISLDPQQITSSNSGHPNNPRKNVASPNWELLHTEASQGLVQGILLDSTVQGQSGGTGTPLPWKELHFKTILAEIKKANIPFILAGGLHPENVQEAIQITQPYGVDVSSGVEREGRKDQEQITRFIHAAKTKASKPQSIR
ncbi:phosphoribosylanthranilate isomerase [Desulfitobacterium sp. AusDCA]|uniref:phosphoribosylanthranilate isomerase n=1 Tax=Desulfitobacterium sp. AusDCA TaxID=3240383 RepID=UPI003DA73D8B